MTENAAIMTTLGPGQARVNVTWAGQNADLPDPVSFDLGDEVIRAMVAEAVRGGFGGIPATNNADLTNFVVDRFAPTADRPYPLLAVRPKTPFGCEP